ncbi:hypothetical protein TrVE_jg196 [Triparma verrucosa]|uniref:Uncharacterized protein n=1 Tax=Triparma verrucosa TaxID=1606542 RepID=A0A9W7CB61_9STRA|nr:hypothetical protein TrVE_jg196 [Triparma verrucosa]
MDDALLKRQLAALKSSPRRNETFVDGNNGFAPEDCIRDAQSKIALRSPPPRKDYTTAPLNPVVTVPGAEADEPSDDLYRQQLERKEYEEFSKLRRNDAAFAPLHTFFAASTIRSAFVQKVLAGGEKMLNVYMGMGSEESIDGNLQSLRLTYYEVTDAGEEEVKTFVPEGWLRPEETNPLDASFDADDFYKNDITLFSKEVREELAEFAQDLVFSDLTKVEPKFGEYSSQCFVPSEETSVCWKELSANAIKDDLVLEEQEKTLEFRANRKPFTVEGRRMKLEAYFAKEYGAEKAKTEGYTWEINEVEEAVSEEAHLAICAENRKKEEAIVQDLADTGAKLFELSEEQKAVFEKRYKKMAEKFGQVEHSFAIFAVPVAPAVTLEAHLAICTENAKKVKAILLEREKEGEAAVEFPKTGLRVWKKTKWNIPEKIAKKITKPSDKRAPSTVQGGLERNEENDSEHARVLLAGKVIIL